MSDHADADSPDTDGRADADDDHLADVEPGAGCTEIWEHLSERRNATREVEEE